jgi:hypothetical protein
MQTDDQITIKDILLKIIRFKNLILRNWLLLLLAVVIGGGIGYFTDYLNKSEPSYNANTTFYLETAVPQNDFGGFSSFLPGGGQQSSGLFSGQNLTTLINSTDFLEKVLLREIDVNGKKEIMANYMFPRILTAKQKEINKEIEARTKMKVYVPFKHTDVNKFTPEEFNSLGNCIGLIAAQTKLTPFEGTSFMSLNVETVNDTLSIIYSQYFLQTLKEYYLETKNSKLNLSLEKQKKIVDSLRYQLQSNEASLAKVQDQNTQSVFLTNKVAESRLNRKTQLLTEAYRTQEAALNNMRFQTYQETPLFKITTPQRFPIPSTQKKIGDSVKPGALIGLFLMLIFITLRNALRAILNEK